MLKNNWRRLAKEIIGTACEKIEDMVKFLGHIPPPDVYKEYAQADLFCGLSRSEALGNVFLEAQAAGCAVIATQVGGIPDIVIKGQTGLLVKPDDPQSAADEIRKVLRDQELRKRLTEAGKRNAQMYDWNIIATQYAKVYSTAYEH